jgi:hypothetical protein
MISHRGRKDEFDQREPNPRSALVTKIWRALLVSLNSHILLPSATVMEKTSLTSENRIAAQLLLDYWKMTSMGRISVI